MSIAISNICIVTVNDANEVISNGLILIQDNRLAYVGPMDASRIPENAYLIDGTGKVAIPGLINCHNHAAMCYLRGLAEDKNLQDWLKDAIWPTELSLRPLHAFQAARLACAEMVCSGTTTFVDQYFYVDQTVKAVKEIGMRAFLAPAVRDQFDAELCAKMLQQNMEYYRLFDGMENGRIRIVLGPHAPYTCSEKMLRECKRISDETGMLLHIHIAETPDDLGPHQAEIGGEMTSFEYLDSIGFLNENVIAAHSVWLTDHDIEIIKKRNVKVVHNPTSNMKVCAGIAPASRLLHEGVTVALGTDSAASNNRLDMFETMKTTALLQKVAMGEAAALTAVQCLRMATIEGAKTIHMSQDLGSLETGKLADIVLLDFQTPHLCPWHPDIPDNTISHIVYSAISSDVSDVIIDVQVIMENRCVKTVQLKQLLNDAQTATEDLLKDAGILGNDKELERVESSYPQHLFDAIEHE